MRISCRYMVLAFLPAVLPAASILYSYQDLGVWQPNALNNRGWAVGTGQSTPEGPQRPVRYRPGIGLEFISGLPGELSDINDAGTAIGWLGRNGFNAIVRPTGQPWTVPNSGADLQNFIKINEAGQIAGEQSDGPSFTIRKAMVYSTELGLVDIHPPEASRHSSTADINEAGQALVWTYGAVFRSFVYDVETENMTDLTPFVSAVTGDPWFIGAAINDAGVVAGRTGKTGSPLVLYDPEEGVRRIGRIGDFIVPNAINNRNWVVGGYGESNRSGAFLYVRGHGIRNLEELIIGEGLRLRDAVDINDRGQILVHGYDNHAYLLNRVFESPELRSIENPEPSTWVCIAAGLAALALRTRGGFRSSFR